MWLCCLLCCHCCWACCQQTLMAPLLGVAEQLSPYCPARPRPLVWQPSTSTCTFTSCLYHTPVLWGPSTLHQKELAFLQGAMDASRHPGAVAVHAAGQPYC